MLCLRDDVVVVGAKCHGELTCGVGRGEDQLDAGPPREGRVRRLFDICSFSKVFLKSLSVFARGRHKTYKRVSSSAFNTYLFLFLVLLSRLRIANSTSKNPRVETKI